MSVKTTMVNQMPAVTITIITNLQALNSGESLEEKEDPKVSVDKYYGNSL